MSHLGGVQWTQPRSIQRKDLTVSTRLSGRPTSCLKNNPEILMDNMQLALDINGWPGSMAGQTSSSRISSPFLVETPHPKIIHHLQISINHIVTMIQIVIFIFPTGKKHLNKYDIIFLLTLPVPKPLLLFRAKKLLASSLPLRSSRRVRRKGPDEQPGVDATTWCRRLVEGCWSWWLM